jgi:hypothetical protein
MAELASVRQAGSDVRFGSKADIRSATAMSALPPKATLDAYLSDVRFVPEADIALVVIQFR